MKCLKKIVLLSMIVFLCIALFGALFLDCTYWNIYRLGCAEKIINELKELNKYNINLSYTHAFEVISGSIGMLLTIINVILNMNISIVQRGESLVYGISRRELEKDNRFILYRWMKRWNFCALFLMLLFINIKFCVCCYFLLGCSYIFLVLHYYIHASSFSKEKDRNALVDTLVALLNEEKTYEERLLNYQSLLESIGANIEKEANWKESEKIFNKLLDSAYCMEERFRFVACTVYYRGIYWRNDKHQSMNIQFIMAYIIRFETRCLKLHKKQKQKMALNEYVIEKEWPVLWGLLDTMFQMADNERVEEFLDWILSEARRGSTVYSKAQKAVPYELLNLEYEMCLIAMELRLQKEDVDSRVMVQQLKDLWNYGNNVFLLQQNDYGNKIVSLYRQMNDGDEKLLEKTINNLADDYLYGLSRTRIANIIKII